MAEPHDAVAETPPPSSENMVNLTAEVLALRLAVSCLIEAMPEFQRKRAAASITALAKASDTHNADMPPFTVGEVATHVMHNTLRDILLQVDRLAAANKRAGPAGL